MLISFLFFSEGFFFMQAQGPLAAARRTQPTPSQANYRSWFILFILAQPGISKSTVDVQVTRIWVITG